ncbi:MAG: 50S ribosomal protein L4 [Alphaproteobacteria bacterium]|nr:50S ribosomal protein L4 [Alphaproteobacteria bacterium]
MLKVPVRNFQGDALEECSVSSEVFAAPIRKDILSRVVQWQLAKRRSGNHKAKGISDISGTTKKPHRQKGTGRARQGSLRSPHMRGGAVIFGPVVRDHSFSLPKKVRKMGLRCALSARMKENKLFVMDNLSMESRKTKDVVQFFSGSVLMIGGETVCQNLKNAISNVHSLNLLPRHGINVYDILRHDQLILSRDAVQYLENFLSVSSD